MDAGDRKLIGTANTFIPMSIDDQGVPIARLPVHVRNTSLATIAANTQSAFQLVDLGEYWYQFQTLTASFDGFVGSLTDITGLFAMSPDFLTNPVRPPAVGGPLSTADTKAILKDFGSVSFVVCGRYFRYGLTNGSTPQVSLGITVLLR